MYDEKRTLWDKFVNSIGWTASLFGTIIIVGMAGLTTLDVILRLFFRAPIVGAAEVCEYMMVAMSLAIGWCALKGKMVKVDIVVHHFPISVQKLLEIIMLFLSLGLCICVVWGAIKDGLGWQKMGYMSSVLGLPKYPFYFVLAVGFGILCLSTFYLLTNRFRRIKP